VTAAAPVFQYDAALPILGRREEIVRAIAAHAVVIVAGDTGSGKSTQLPKFCLEAGRGAAAMIAHTQPRRLAARALAARIAQELAQPVGATVGYRVRFADQVSTETRLVLMTDGILLAELAADPELRRYDTVIVDEAHERTLNVDLLLGVLKRLLPRRPELKLVVTSATLDIERIARFFGDAPVITVSGRAHPVEVRYREEPEPEDPDIAAAVLRALREIEAEPGQIGSGDVLVFLPGEREIRDVGEVLERELNSGAEIVPLYSRLPWEQQSRIFQPGAGRRVVLATNVAETSITVPGIRAVIDSGLARISRYSVRSRLQRLPIEPVSRASADQRKGRCGRLGPGLCVRLFSEADFAARAGYTEPEILRTNLAALLLRLAADGLGDAERFPFIDPPDTRALNDGYRLLQELAALDADRRITRLGRDMARVPLDPRLARALFESRRFRAESEVLAIVSGLSVPDVRLGEAPGAPADPDRTQPFEDSKSEFSTLYKIWRGYRTARAGSRRELRRWCRERRLSLLRLSEWDNVYSQLAERAAQAGIAAGRRTPGREASYTAVHRSLLAGFATSVGMRGEAGEYLGTRGLHFHLFPGSPVRRRKPRWVMAASIVETSRVFARQIAEIEPSWIEAAAQHLLKREFLEPDWDEAREEVVARERVSLLGLVLRAGQVVNYGPIAPEESRLIFAREALVHGRLARRPGWLLANDAELAAAQRLEERLRTRGLTLPAESLIEFYDQALPRQVSSGATLEHFTRRLSEAGRAALHLRPDQIYAREPDPSELARFPERLTVPVGEDWAAAATASSPPVTIEVEYRFAPDEPGDGATLQLPLLAVPVLTRAVLDAAVPGFAAPRVEALLRSLPKDARRGLIPIAGSAAAYLEWAARRDPDRALLGRWLTEERGIPEAWLKFEPATVPAHLWPRFAAVEAGAPPALADDLPTLRRSTAARARSRLDALAAVAYPGPWQRFESDSLAEVHWVSADDAAAPIVAVHPALTRRADGIHVRYEYTAAEAGREHAWGGVHLARELLGRAARSLEKRVADDSALVLASSPHLQGPLLVDVMTHATVRLAAFADGDVPRRRTEFDAAVERAGSGLHGAFDAVRARLLAWFADARAVRRLSDDPRAASQGTLAAESRAHLDRLLAADTLTRAPAEWLRQIPRYIKAEERRWQRLLARHQEAPAIARELAAWDRRAALLESRAAAELRHPPPLDELRWWMRELRVSLIAQELKTVAPVSAARLAQRAADIEAWLQR
jgi:ATP-dependent helicase HrpA